MGQQFSWDAVQTEGEMDVAELQEWYKKFVVECPSGTLFMHEFKHFFKVTGNEEATQYVEGMFRAFDKNGVRPSEGEDWWPVHLAHFSSLSERIIPDAGSQPPSPPALLFSPFPSHLSSKTLLSLPHLSASSLLPVSVLSSDSPSLFFLRAEGRLGRRAHRPVLSVYVSRGSAAPGPGFSPSRAPATLTKAVSQIGRAILAQIVSSPSLGSFELKLVRSSHQEGLGHPMDYCESPF